MLTINAAALSRISSDTKNITSVNQITYPSSFTSSINSTKKTDVRVFKNGYVYEGEFHHKQKNKFHGKGLLKKVNKGEVYEGNFEFGKPDGLGKLTYKNGSYYEGEFSEGKKHGKGLTYFNDCTYHRGNYFKGRAVGKCKMQFYVILPATFYDNPQPKLANLSNISTKLSQNFNDDQDKISILKNHKFQHKIEEFVPIFYPDSNKTLHLVEYIGYCENFIPNLDVSNPTE
jgi:MORN repeat